MATCEQNQEKRDEMRGQIVVLGHMGWSRAAIAYVMRVSVSCVGAWARGRSMGTNAQRLALSALPMWSDVEQGPRYWGPCQCAERDYGLCVSCRCKARV